MLSAKQNTWYKKAKTIEDITLTHLGTNTPDKNQIKRHHKNTMHTLKMAYETYWLQTLNSNQSRVKNKGGNKLRTYRKFKQHFSLEPYLQHIDNIPHRKAVTRLRLSSHSLNIEAMHTNTPNPTERICNICNSKEMEDEEHFTMGCEAYNAPRKEMMDTCQSICSNFMALDKKDKFLWVLTNEDKAVLKALGKFIFVSLELRKTKVHQAKDPSPE